MLGMLGKDSQILVTGRRELRQLERTGSAATFLLTFAYFRESFMTAARRLARSVRASAKKLDLTEVVLFPLTPSPLPVGARER
jgi:hypothetical protein